MTIDYKFSCVFIITVENFLKIYYTILSILYVFNIDKDQRQKTKFITDFEIVSNKRLELNKNMWFGKFEISWNFIYKLQVDLLIN